MAQPQFNFNFENNNEEEEGLEVVVSLKELKEKAIAAQPDEIRPTIEQLNTLQGKYEDAAKNFQKEFFELQRKYEALYAPLFEERSKVTQESIPQFWKTVLSNSEVQDLISERDEDSLQYLRNITCETFVVPADAEAAEGDDDEEKAVEGFRLTFHYAENPYFSNDTLTQTMYYNANGDIIEGKFDGCVINWKGQDKNLTVTVTAAKKAGKKKGAKKPQAPVVRPCESFYNFFGSPDALDEEEDEEMMNIAGDEQIAMILKEKVIPRAVDYFLGIVNLEDDLAIDEDMFGDYEGEDDEGDDDEEDAAPRRKGAKATQGGDQQECKQQ